MTAALLVLALLLNDLEIGVLILGLSSLFFFSNVWGLPEKIDIRLERDIVPDETFGDEDVRVESRLRNMTGATLGNIEIQEILDGRIIPERGASYTPASVAPSEELRLIFEFPSPPRANYEIGPLIARVRDPFGFYLTEKKLGPETLSVMPRPDRLRDTRLRPRRVGPWPGVIPSKILGLGTEFYSMRDYIPGDDPKRINWKASARHGELIVNETEAERVTDVMIVLDTDVTFYEPSEAELFERGVRAAASVTSLLLKQGNRVGVILQGHERGIIPPKFGKKHERNVLFLLAAAKPGPAAIPTSYVVTLLARLMLPSKAQVILISPLLDPSIVEGMRELAVSGYSTMILSPSPPEPPRFESEAEDLAYRM